MSIAGRASRVLADDLPQKPAPSPEQILAAGAVQARTQNILKRYLADAPATDGEWTFGRLLAIPGFGQRALDDVVAALGNPRPPSTPPFAGRRPHRFLD